MRKNSSLITVPGPPLTETNFRFQMYYRQKGQRNPTRPQAIHENFDLCAEALDQRLISYKKQSEEYHNSCIQGEMKCEAETYLAGLFSSQTYLAVIVL